MPSWLCIILGRCIISGLFYEREFKWISIFFHVRYAILFFRYCCFEYLKKFSNIHFHFSFLESKLWSVFFYSSSWSKSSLGCQEHVCRLWWGFYHQKNSSKMVFTFEGITFWLEGHLTLRTISKFGWRPFEYNNDNPHKRTHQYTRLWRFNRCSTYEIQGLAWKARNMSTTCFERE